MKVSLDRSPTETIPARIKKLLSRRLNAQAIGDAGLKRVIDEELAEARAEHQRLTRLGDSIIDAALVSPGSPAHRGKRGLV